MGERTRKPPTSKVAVKQGQARLATQQQALPAQKSLPAEKRRDVRTVATGNGKRIKSVYLLHGYR